MRTTIDLPETLVERLKIAAAKNRTTMRDLTIRGLEKILAEEGSSQRPNRSALERLEAGYSLGGKFLTREEAHAR